MSKVLIIGDTHLPYTRWDVLREIARYAKFFKPDRIVQMGDFTDQYVWSRYDKDLDCPSPDGEWEQTEAAVHKFMELFSPKIPIDVLRGNHDTRIIGKALLAQTPSKLQRALSDVFPYDNLKFHPGMDPLAIDNVLYFHGHEVKYLPTALSKAKAYGKSCVQGHDHKAVLEYINILDHQTFAMSVGCTMNRLSLAGNYARNNPSRSWLGCAEVIDGKFPSLHPFGSL